MMVHCYIPTVTWKHKAASLGDWHGQDPYFHVTFSKSLSKFQFLLLELYKGLSISSATAKKLGKFKRLSMEPCWKRILWNERKSLRRNKGINFTSTQAQTQHTPNSTGIPQHVRKFSSQWCMLVLYAIKFPWNKFLKVLTSFAATLYTCLPKLFLTICINPFMVKWIPKQLFTDKSTLHKRLVWVPRKIQ